MTMWGVYALCSAVVTLTIMLVLLNGRKQFRKQARLDPPDVIYGTDYLGMVDKSVVVWETPKLADWTAEQIAESAGFYTFGCILMGAATLFLTATGLMLLLGVK
jgi:hypothetical protein